MKTGSVQNFSKNKEDMLRKSLPYREWYGPFSNFDPNDGRVKHRYDLPKHLRLNPKPARSSILLSKVRPKPAQVRNMPAGQRIEKSKANLEMNALKIKLYSNKRNKNIERTKLKKNINNKLQQQDPLDPLGNANKLQKIIVNLTKRLDLLERTQKRNNLFIQAAEAAFPIRVRDKAKNHALHIGEEGYFPFNIKQAWA